MKTISLTNDAYETLEAERREGETFSDVVRRLTGGVRLAEYHGALEGDTADEVAAIVDRRREERTDTSRERVAEFVDKLNA